jgi:hypothetical protein
MSKLDCFGDQQWIHEVLDFLIVYSKGQQGFLPWIQKLLPWM